MRAQRQLFRDWSDFSPDAKPCYIAIHPDGSFAAVHLSARAARMNVGPTGTIMPMPLFDRVPVARTMEEQKKRARKTGIYKMEVPE